MPAVSYRVPDLPKNGAEAFLPVPPPVATPYVLSSEGLVHVFGAPGTVAFPSPAPALTEGTVVESTQPGQISPQATPWAPLVPPAGTRTPAIYFATAENMGPQRGALGVRVNHNEDMPMPATRIKTVAGVAQRTPARTYGRVTPWPRVFPRFRSVLDPPGRS